jgi:hypothetical protein
MRIRFVQRVQFSAAVIVRITVVIGNAFAAQIVVRALNSVWNRLTRGRKSNLIRMNASYRGPETLGRAGPYTACTRNPLTGMEIQFLTLQIAIL